MWPLNLETYRKMLQTVIERRQTIRYREINAYQDFVLWRHDCDMSLNRARYIAEVDAEHGVASTFFILPHSDFYNVLELGQTKLIREISGLGHDIGLHLDVEYHSAVSEIFDIENAITKDKEILEDVAEVKIEAFSFHNPTTEMLKFNQGTYSGLINCYSKKIWDEVDYCSDSNGYWRHEPIPEVLQDTRRAKLQILTHPEWWLDETSLPRDHVLRCVYGRSVKVMNDYDQAMSRFANRENIMSYDSQESDFERAFKLL